jgi:phenylpropionate dioxygenase-like ring-hydroxylating dioxygenase large terminal subunit
MERSGGQPAFFTDRYTSPEFLEQERAKVFRKTWLVLARESDVARDGDCLPVDELGESLLVVRDRDGRVRTFQNTCRHRGTRLISRKCQLARLSCPYHGWTYGLDGRLVRVPKQEGFDALDKERHGLFPLRTECWGGFVWITFDNEAPPLEQYLGSLVEQLAAYRLDAMRPLYRKTWDLPCNWKAVLDQATESYHLESVHGRSIGRIVDALPTFHPLDPHHLQTVPVADFGWRHWIDRASVLDPADFEPDQLRLFHKYVVFPNTLLNVMPYHLTVFRVFPITASSCRFHYEFHVPRGAGPIARMRGALTLAASLLILKEDFEILPLFQAGVKTAAKRSIRFHREERPLEYFHGVLDRHLRA